LKIEEREGTIEGSEVLQEMGGDLVGSKANMKPFPRCEPSRLMLPVLACL
jgi:hypothetical protein